ncbi:hypothetical protein [Bosea robiniae]|uniref:hypothetical protein n=1 Tax=Bosea robiniae TaxID=1036780 RepID=UPI00147E8642|nr:hypothetical protein [Bosea robiniae]
MILQADGDDGIVVAALAALAAAAIAATTTTAAAALLGHGSGRKRQGRKQKADDLDFAGHDITSNDCQHILLMSFGRGT